MSRHTWSEDQARTHALERRRTESVVIWTLVAIGALAAAVLLTTAVIGCSPPRQAEAPAPELPPGLVIVNPEGGGG
jgi:hypothetical protein